MGEIEVKEVMEGKYYVCGWRKNRFGYEVWVLDSPKVMARGKTFEKADQSLAELICERLGDGESKREFVPAVPSSRMQQVSHVTVWGDKFVDQIDDDVELFTKGKCSLCRAALGSRNGQLLKIEKMPSGFNGAFTGAGKTIYLFSERFVRFLQRSAGVELLWRNVNCPGKQVVLELLQNGSIPEVYDRDRNLSGWVCEVCRTPRVFYSDRERVRHNICVNDPQKLPIVFTIDSPFGLKLAMESELWASLRGKPETKGLISAPIGFLQPHHVSQFETLPSYTEYQANYNR